MFITGCSIARGAPTILNLLFVDDCYFFFKATGVEANVMKKILNRYAEISWQMINYSKSIVTFSPNTSEVNIQEVGLQVGVIEDSVPGNYL